jgi:hypothetical protein
MSSENQPTLNEIAQGFHAQLQSLREEMLRNHNQALQLIQEQLVRQQAENQRLEQQLQNLHVAVQRYTSSDRYALTRAQVMKAMREHERESRKGTRK